MLRVNTCNVLSFFPRSSLFNPTIVHSSRSFHFIISIRFFQLFHFHEISSVFHSQPILPSLKKQHVNKRKPIDNSSSKFCNEQPLEIQIENHGDEKKEEKSLQCLRKDCYNNNELSLPCDVQIEKYNFQWRTWPAQDFIGKLLNWILGQTPPLGMAKNLFLASCSLRRKCLNKLISYFYCLSFRFVLCVHRRFIQRGKNLFCLSNVFMATRETKEAKEIFPWSFIVST